MNEIINKKIDEKIICGESNNGIKIYYMPKKGYTKQYGIFATNYGSIDNKFIPIGEEDYLEFPAGIAHFLEHKLFEEPDKNIFDIYSRLGVDVNAFTSFDRTAYVFSSTENFYPALENLVKFVQNPYFTDENVEKEKGIIEQELKMYEDNPGSRVFNNMLTCLYNQHPVRIDIGGSIESIQDIDKELLYKSYNTFYHPSNMVLFLIGDLDFNKIINSVNNVENKYEKLESPIDRYKIKEDNNINQKEIVEYMEVPMPIFYIGFKDLDIGYKGYELAKKDIVTDMILDCLFGSSTEFYQELYEEGLIDSSFGAAYSGEESYGYSVIVGQSKKPYKVHDRIKKYMSRPAKDIIDEDVFNRIKKKYIGQNLFSFNSIENIGNNFVDLYFDDFSILDIQELLEEIEYKDLIDRYEKHFKEEYSAISIIKPLSES